MDNTTRYSFFQLFAKGNDLHPGNYKLVIPLIQRDYAQGRDNDKAREVRTEFLSQLFDYITTPQGCHDLDFVYGITSPASDASKKKDFIPLDGQQRLTTLFLIHLYLAIRAKGTEESSKFFKTMQLRNDKLIESVFSYRTRSSAEEFCNGLIDEKNNLHEFFELSENESKKYEGRFSRFIRNSNWFYPDWKQDPTVDGMLTMLDAIDKKLYDCDHQEILQRLLSKENPPVTFIFMNLEDYKLTDDLYIKMNSRGKPLTPFENFKAKYEQYISSQEKDGNLSSIVSLIAGTRNKTIQTVKDYFAFNIDTKWADIFWKYSKEEIKTKEEELSKEDNKQSNSLDRLLSDTLDAKISRFIKMVLTNQYALAYGTGKIAIPDYLTSDKALSFSNLSDIGAISVDGIVLLIRTLDMFADRPLKIMPRWAQRYYDEVGAFESIIQGKDFSFTKRLLMYAYTMYRLQFGDDNPSNLVEWMRFIYNITLDDNTIQDITKNTYHRAVSAVSALINKMQIRNERSIVNLLAESTLKDKPDFFPEYQYMEEILKSALFLKDGENSLHSKSNPLSSSETKNSSWGNMILELESHPYFTGQIGFVLHMAGIHHYFIDHNDLKWDAEEDKKFKTNVLRYGRIASAVFEGGFTKRKLARNAVFERAMLALHPEYISRNLLNSTRKSVGSNNLIRDLSWKSMLRLSEDRFDKQAMVKDLFDHLDENNPVASMHSIIDSDPTGPQWRKDMVKYGYLMEKSTNGYFDKTEDGHRILNSRIYFSMGDHEIYSLILYWEFLSKKGAKKQLASFHLSYGNSNSWNEIPFIKLAYGDLTMKVKSYVRKGDGQLICHYLWIDANGNVSLEDFLLKNDFQKKAETDTILRRREAEWNQDSCIDSYRESIAENILQFTEKLSAFIDNNVQGQE